MICFGILWWCVGIAPFLNFMRMQQEISERYVYLPNVGLMFIVASLLHNFPYVTMGIFMMYATKMWFYMGAYKDDFWLVEYSVLNSPESWFGWHIRGHQRLGAQSHKEAQIFWVIALNLSPKEFKILFNIASSLAVMGPQYHAEALQYLKKAEENIPAGQEEMAQKIVNDFKSGKVTFLV